MRPVWGDRLNGPFWKASLCPVCQGSQVAYSLYERNREDFSRARGLIAPAARRGNHFDWVFLDQGSQTQGNSRVQISLANWGLFGFLRFFRFIFSYFTALALSCLDV